ncbi:MAG: hypothetical protein ACYCX4_01650 [Bacillota bacterium]
MGVKEFLIKAQKGEMVPGHKYLYRMHGTKGNYRYIYAHEQLSLEDLWNQTINDPNKIPVVSALQSTSFEDEFARVARLTTPQQYEAYTKKARKFFIDKGIKVTLPMNLTPHGKAQYMELVYDLVRLTDKFIKVPYSRLSRVSIKSIGTTAGGLYDPWEKIITIDRNHPNSVLHEIGHFVDNMGFRKDNEKAGFVYASKSGPLKQFAQKLREQLSQKAFIEKLSKDKYRRHGRSIENYWDTPIEVFARFFEQWMTKKLLGLGVKENSVFIPRGFQGTYSPEEMAILGIDFEGVLSSHELAKSLIKSISGWLLLEVGQK